ncbi:MAG: hypothetical protein HYY43_01725 [Deltaproteobacteria bacterium]|nr:hypothetical protein [Deltaproteobacteria bacterium]MBI2974296.1 hypothetical protein [Deltaproteobacteria bacterium]
MAKKKNILPPPINPQKEPITVAVLSGKLEALFHNVKEMVTTTVKGTENVLRKEIERLDNKIDLTQHAVTEHTKMIKNLDVKIDGVEKRLDAKIDGVRIELKEDIQQVEQRLSGKIDKIGERQDDHEGRIIILEKNQIAHA